MSMSIFSVQQQSYGMC